MDLHGISTEQLQRELYSRQAAILGAQDRIAATWWTATANEKIHVLKQMNKPYAQFYLDSMVAGGLLNPTGSRVYGHGIEPADYDYVTSQPFGMFRNTIGPPLPRNPRGWTEEYTDSIHVRWGLHVDGKVINFIFTAPDTEKAWIEATKWTAKLVQEIPDVGRYKWRRVRLMRALKDVILGATKLENLGADLPIIEALNKSVCINCGREAINFIDQAHKVQYLADGICDRCQKS